MQNRESLERRVADLERRLAAFQAGTRRNWGVRRRADFEIANLPLYDIAFGPDLAKGEIHGRARGIVALGDFASGVIAIGGLARGVVAVGGLALGLFTAGGLSVGALVAVGGLAIGGVAFGGGALGGVAIGGGAAGHYACGGGAVGTYVVSPARRDPEAQAFFREYGLEGACGRGPRR